jgi:hypothetical protein
MSVPRITEILEKGLNSSGTFSLGASTNFIGRSGAVCFKASTNFTRPANTTQYTLNDAITDSTSIPTIMSFDLASFGAVVGQFFCITNARVISSVKPTSAQLLANLWVFMTTFTATNDNSELSIDDTTTQSGGLVIPCGNGYQTALNHRCVSDSGQWIGKLASNDTKLFFTLQDASGYTPQSGERFDVMIEGMLL